MPCAHADSNGWTMVKVTKGKENEGDDAERQHGRYAAP